MKITGACLPPVGQIMVQETAMKTSSLFYDESKAGIAAVLTELREANVALLAGMEGNVHSNFEKAINTTDNKVENVCKTIEALAAEMWTHATVSALVDVDANINAGGK